MDCARLRLLAVIAGFGAPERAEPFDDRDPRKPARADAFRSPAELGARLAAEQTRWFVVTNRHLPIAEQVAEPQARAGHLALYRLSH